MCTFVCVLYVCEHCTYVCAVYICVLCTYVCAVYICVLCTYVCMFFNVNKVCSYSSSILAPPHLPPSSLPPPSLPPPSAWGNLLGVMVQDALKQAMGGDVAFRRGIPCNLLGLPGGFCHNVGGATLMEGDTSEVSTHVSKLIGKLTDHLQATVSVKAYSKDFMASRLPPYGYCRDSVMQGVYTCSPHTTHAHTHAHTAHAPTHTHTYTHAHTHAHTHCIHTHAYARTHTDSHTYIHTARAFTGPKQ